MANVIEIQELVKSYRMGDGWSAPVLKSIDMQIDTGEFVAIMGPSGSGKTTLMNILGLLDRQTGGTYLLDDHDTKAMSDSALAALRNKALGFVFQNYNLLPRRTVLENIALPLLYAGMGREESLEVSSGMLSKVQLEARADYFPTQLSGGQQQRVALARALVNKPKLILADEPTGNLDSKTGAEIMKLFEDLNEQGVTIVLVTHEPDIAKYAKRLVQVKDGEIIYDGPMY